MGELKGQTKVYYESAVCQKALIPFLKLITKRHADHGGVTEIRILGGPGGKRGTWSGFFDHAHAETLFNKILPLPMSPRTKIPFGDYPRQGEANFYFSMHPVHPDLLGRVNNTIQWAEQTASDSDIVAYDLVAVDIDPVRKSQISATDAEKHAALLVANKVREYLLKDHQVKSILADSGNGYHILIPLIPYSGDAMTKAVEDAHLFLDFLAERFNTSEAKVDTTIYNAARILRLYGTQAKKGASIEGVRPHRYSQINLSDIPEDIDLFSRMKETLDAYRQELKDRQKIKAAAAAPVTSTSSKNGASWPREDSIKVLDGILTISGHTYRTQEKSGRVLFIFKDCPYHQDKDEHEYECAVMVEPDGHYSASCKHDANAHWKDFKAVIGWEQHKKGVMQSLGLWRDKKPRSPEAASIDNEATGGTNLSGDPRRFFGPKMAFWPARLSTEILATHDFLCSPIDDGGKGVRLMVYEDGVFRSGESRARVLAHSLLMHYSKPSYIDQAVALVHETSKTPPDQLNAKALDLINVQNGMLDWRTKELLPHKAEYRSTFQISAAFDPNCQCPIIDRFLTDVFPDDALALVEEVLGYLLLPTARYQIAIMLLGPGANGKSTFLQALIVFLGEENVSHISLQDLSENRFTAAELVGKLANIYPDLPSKALEQSDIFKAVVSGDTIKAERKFQHPFDLRPTARLLFSANELPHTKDLTRAFFRRWRIIPFVQIFEGSKADKSMLLKLTTPEARSTLLNHALAGLRRLEANQGFTECTSVMDATEKYRRQCDNVFEFTSEHLEVRSGSTLPKAVVYEEYEKWCKELGVPHPVSQKGFNRRLSELLGATEGREILSDGKKVRVWQGIAWQGDTPGLDRLGPGRPGSAYFSSLGISGNGTSEKEEEGVGNQNGEKWSGPGHSGPSRSTASQGNLFPSPDAPSTTPEPKFLNGDLPASINDWPADWTALYKESISDLTKNGSYDESSAREIAEAMIREEYARHKPSAEVSK